MKPDNFLHVLYHDRPVGTLAMASNRMIAFEYTDEWLERGFSISPFSLPLQKQVFIPAKDELLAVGAGAGMDRSKCLHIAEEIHTCVTKNLGAYLS